MKLYIHSFIFLRVEQSVGGGFISHFILLWMECTIGILKKSVLSLIHELPLRRLMSYIYIYIYIYIWSTHS